ncbi:hypothetical protein D9M73_252970 [compost metagenome]
MATESIWKPLAVNTRASQNAMKGRCWRSSKGVWLGIGSNGLGGGGARLSLLCNSWLPRWAVVCVQRTESRVGKGGEATGHAAIDHAVAMAV